MSDFDIEIDYTECEAHRRRAGLICNDLGGIDCKTECEVEDTCPLNPDNVAEAEQV